MARPSEYTPEKADNICARLADGESLRSICLSDKMPDRTTVFRWLRENPEFNIQYARSRDAQAALYAEDVVDISDEPVQDALSIQRNRLRIDARKWLAGKLRPKVYGDKYVAIEQKPAEEKDDDVSLLSDAELDAALAKGVAALSTAKQERTEK